MPLSTPLPFGLRDVKVTPVDATDDSLGTAVDFPNARTLSFSETEDTEELRGDDGLVAIHGSGASADWSLEGGGFDVNAVAVMYGGTVAESGTTPNIVVTYEKTDTDQRPYFRIDGQAVSDSGGDFHCTLHRCKATGELSGELSDGSFFLTDTSGRALGRVTDGIVYTMTQNETETAINPV